MAWVKLDDQVSRHPKMIKAGPAACWLWVCGLAYCQSQLTDGFIPADCLPMICSARRVGELARTLLASGLWVTAKGGFQVHDYLDFNEPAAQVKDRLKADVERKRAQKLEKDKISGRNPSGIQEISKRIPEQPSRARASHPIPSHPISEEKEQARVKASAHTTSGKNGARSYQKTPIIGRNVHLHHVLCDDSLSYCVPASVHHKLAGLLAPKHAGDQDRAAEALMAWYPTVWEKLAKDFVMGDAFKFWQGQFDTAFASRGAQMVSDTTKQNIENARNVIARMQAQK